MYVLVRGLNMYVLVRVHAYPFARLYPLSFAALLPACLLHSLGLVMLALGPLAPYLASQRLAFCIV